MGYGWIFGAVVLGGGKIVPTNWMYVREKAVRVLLFGGMLVSIDGR